MNAQQAVEQGYELGQGVQQDAQGQLYQHATRSLKTHCIKTIEINAENPDMYEIVGQYFDPKIQQEHLKIKVFATDYNGKRKRI